MSVAEESRAFAEQIGRDAGKEGIAVTEFWQRVADAGFTPEFPIDRGRLITSAHLRHVEDRYFNKGFVLAPPMRSAKRVKAADKVVKPTPSSEPLVLKLASGEVKISSERIEAHFKKVKQVTIEFED